MGADLNKTALVYQRAPEQSNRIGLAAIVGAADRPAMIDQRALVKLLTTMRHNAGLSQEALAARLGHAQSWAYKLEAGQRRVTLPTAAAWAEACGYQLRLGVEGRASEEAVALFSDRTVGLMLAAADLSPEHLDLLTRLARMLPLASADALAIVRAAVVALEQQQRHRDGKREEN